MLKEVLSVLKPRLTSSLIVKRSFYEHPRESFPKVYHKPPPNLTFLEKLRLAAREFRGEFKLLYKELREDYSFLHTTHIVPNEDDVVWKFDGTEKSVDQWIVNCDRDYSVGYSIAKLELSSSGTGVFHGVLDTRVPKDGKTERSGYCNITTIRKLKSFKREDFYDWTKYNELVLRVRGDGRTYMLNILQRGYWDITWYDMFNYMLYTRGGPYWQVVRIPFAKFVHSSKGQIHENQYNMTESRVTNFGITLADKKPGPFRLEIDYIAVCYNPELFETFAYEQYNVPGRS